MTTVLVTLFRTLLNAAHTICPVLDAM